MIPPPGWGQFQPGGCVEGKPASGLVQCIRPLGLPGPSARTRWLKQQTVSQLCGWKSEIHVSAGLAPVGPAREGPGPGLSPRLVDGCLLPVPLHMVILCVRLCPDSLFIKTLLSISSGCPNETPLTTRLRQQRCLVSQPWGLKGKAWRGLVSGEHSLPGLRMVFSPRGESSGVKSHQPVT